MEHAHRPRQRHVATSARRSSRRARRAGRAARRARQARGNRRRYRRRPPSASSSTPKRIGNAAAASGSRPVTRSARRGSRWASSGKNSARRKRPARSGSSAAMRSASTHSKRSVRSAKRREVGRIARLGHAPGCRCAPCRGNARSTSRSTARPTSATSGSVVARSHHGASMPPAIHEQLPSPSARPRSTISTADATLGKLERAGEAGNAGANDNDGGLGQSMNSRSFAGMTRIRFKGFSPIGCLSPDSWTEAGHPSDVT